MSDDARVVINDDVMRRLPREDFIKQTLLDHAEKVARRARQFAPKHTGAGAASLRAEAVLDNGAWVAVVGTAPPYRYMDFQQWGTVHVTATKFIEKALR